jgi:hypothetical protein
VSSRKLSGSVLDQLFSVPAGRIFTVGEREIIKLALVFPIK